MQKDLKGYYVKSFAKYEYKVFTDDCWVKGEIFSFKATSWRIMFCPIEPASITV